MRLIGREKLKRVSDEVDRWICSWCAEVAQAHWRRPEDLTEQFPNARTRPEGDFLFPIGRSGYSLLLQVAFAQGVALITDMYKIDIPNGR